MAAQALYRRWRPQTFDDVIGQTHVTRTLRNALASGRVAHAYLFTGPRGTGKTSVARILAKAVNCIGDGREKPCNACTICRSLNEGRSLDLIEIDAASNRGIDEIREIRDKAGFRPNEARYKVYIVDEVHMLTEPAFNALLKTLEEPPPHVIFVLATTEPHKIPATILSRCQRFDFRRVPLAELVGKLHHICQAEGVVAEPAALELIARSATGSFRDAESLLDQLVAAADGTVTLEQVQSLLGVASAELAADLVELLIRHDVSGGLRLINEAIDNGADPRQFARQILEYLRGILLVQTDSSSLLNVSAEMRARMEPQAQRIAPQELVATIKLFSEAAQTMKSGLQPQLPLELAFVEATLREGTMQATAPKTAAEILSAPVQGSTAHPSAPALRPAQRAASAQPAEPHSHTEPVQLASEAQPAQITQTPRTPEASSLNNLLAHWSEVLAAVRAQSRIIEALLKDCRPIGVEGQTVILGFFYSSHQKRIEEPKTKTLVEQALSQVLGGNFRLQCKLTPKSPQEMEAERPKNKFEVATEDPLIQMALKKYGARVANIEDTKEEPRQQTGSSGSQAD